MDPSKDIYHKEEVPPLAQRKKRHSRRAREHDQALSSESAPGGGESQPEGDSSVSARVPSSFRSRHASHRHRRQESNLANRIMWPILGVVLLGYMAALAVSFFIHAKPASAPAPAPAQAAAEPSHVKDVDKARMQRDQEEIAASVRQWSQAAMLFKAAIALRQNSQLELAAEKLKEALKVSPNLADAQIELASIALQQKNYDDAVDLLRKALEVRPDLAEARLALANAFASQRNFPACLSVAQWIIESEPYSVESHQLAATACMNMGQPALAVDHLKKVVAVERSDLIAQNMLAQAYTELKQQDKALAVLKEVQTLDPENSMSYYNLAVCYAQQSMAQQALDVLSEAAGLFGSAFVDGWTRSADFDSLRSDAGFLAFQKELAKKAGPVTTNAAPGIAPAPDSNAAPAAAGN